MHAQQLALYMLHNVCSSGRNLQAFADEKMRGYFLSKLVALIQQDTEIVFYLPGFPAKSPNRKKTISHLADMAEYLGLERLNSLCKHISSYYCHGAKIVICCDGHIFSDLVDVSDSDVDAYAAGLISIMESFGLKHIEIFSTGDIFPKLKGADMRMELVAKFGESLGEIRNKVLTDEVARKKFNSIHHFILEDTIAILHNAISQNQLRERCKATAYEVVQRSNSWGNAIKSRFPSAIRLSIHPQPENSDQLFYQLANCADIRVTPWHSSAMISCGGFRLIKREQAEVLGAKLSYSHSGLPYFSLS